MADALSIYRPVPDIPQWYEDQLDYGDIRSHILSALQTAQAPQVFAVEGDWGSGKTSVLHHLYNTLEGECPQNPSFRGEAKAPDPLAFAHIRTIWFEAWRYQHEEKPVVALLAEMRRQLAEGRKHFEVFNKNKDVPLLLGLLDKLDTGLDLAGKWLATAGLAVGEPITATIGLAAKLGSFMLKRGKEEPKSSGSHTYDLRQLLDHVIGEYLAAFRKAAAPGDAAPVAPADPNAINTEPRLVIMIDDLDRCEPRTAFRLLEGIKTWLDLRSCIFLLGVNRRELRLAIREQLLRDGPDPALASFKPEERDTLRARELARADEYLEKLCNHCWALPVLTPMQRVEFACESLGDVPRAADLCKVLKMTGAELTPPSGTPGIPILRLPPNPRRIKAITNRLRYILGRRSNEIPNMDDGKDRWLSTAIFAAALYVLHPDIHRLLQTCPHLIEKIPLICTETDVSGLPDSLQESRLKMPGKIEGADWKYQHDATDDSDSCYFLLQHFVAVHQPGCAGSNLTPWLSL